MSADCALETAEFLAAFRAKAFRRRIPLGGLFSLTHRCNFDCVHCYIPSRARKTKTELPAETICALLDQVADAGCLSLVLSGGEPLIRRDFCEIYEHTIRCGLLVTVFTNGALIRAEHLKLFAAYPPRAVEVTLYGASEETYAKVTRRRGQFDAVMRGLRALREAGVRLRIKTMLMNLTEKELPAMERIAEDLGAPFRFDAALSPRLDGDQQPTRFRLAPDSVVATERTSTYSIARLDRNPPLVRPSRLLYTCGAGRTGFHIDPCGRVSPCVMMPWRTLDATRLGFSEAWRRLGEEMNRLRAPSNFPCRRCALKNRCGYCPAVFKLETGRETKASKYLCALGHLRQPMSP